MVHKNYKWNISKERGSNIIYNTIDNILLEKTNHSIDYDELIFLLNNRTKHIQFINNNKRKNIHNYIKNIFGSLIQFIDQYDHFVISKKKSNIIVQFNPIEMNEWIFVE